MAPSGAYPGTSNGLGPDTFNLDLRNFSTVLRWQMNTFSTCLSMHPELSPSFKSNASTAILKVMEAADTCQYELLSLVASSPRDHSGFKQVAKAARANERGYSSEGSAMNAERGIDPDVVDVVVAREGNSQEVRTSKPLRQDADGDAIFPVSLDRPSQNGGGSARGSRDPPAKIVTLHTGSPQVVCLSGEESQTTGHSLPFSEPPKSEDDWIGRHSEPDTPKRKSQFDQEGGEGKGKLKRQLSLADQFMAPRGDGSVLEASGTSAMTKVDSMAVGGPGSDDYLSEEDEMAECSLELLDDEDEDPVGCMIDGALNPNFPGRLAWDLNTMLLVMGDVMILPFQMAYGHGRDPSGFDSFWLWTTTSFFSCDIIISFRTAYQAGAKDLDTEPGKLVTNKMKIVRHYMKTWLSIDFVSTIPWGLLSSLLAGGDSGSAGQLGKLTKVVKFVRFMRLMRMLRLAKLAVIWERVEAKCGSTLLLQGVALFRVLFVLIFICHWNACIWWIVGQPSSIVTELLDEETQKTWQSIPHWTTIQRSNGEGEPTWAWIDKTTTEAYLFCFYWTLGVMRTMPAEVIPVTLPERVYIMIFMFFAFSAFAICVAQITQTFFKFSDRKRLFSDDMASVRMYLRKLNVSDQLQMKIKAFIRHLYDTRSINAREQFLLNLLPDHHKRELAHVKKAAFLMKLPLFENVSFRALQVVTEITESRDLVPGDVLSWAGVPSKAAWVPMVGRVRAKPPKDCDDPDAISRLKINAIDLETLVTWQTHRSKLTVVCITGCTCLKIDKEKFLERTHGDSSFWGGLTASSSLGGHNHWALGRRQTLQSDARDNMDSAKKEMDRQQEADELRMRQTAAVIAS